MADDLTSELDRIAERDQAVFRKRGYIGGLLAINAAKDDTPRLLAALRAVLELAEDAALMSIDASGAACAWDLDPAKVREAITREITGTGESDG